MKVLIVCSIALCFLQVISADYNEDFTIQQTRCVLGKTQSLYRQIDSLNESPACGDSQALVDDINELYKEVDEFIPDQFLQSVNLRLEKIAQYETTLKTACPRIYGQVEGIKNILYAITKCYNL